jgi:hypothetical protein
MFFVTNLDTIDGYILLAFMCNYALSGRQVFSHFPGISKVPTAHVQFEYYLHVQCGMPYCKNQYTSIYLSILLQLYSPFGSSADYVV